MAKADQFHGAIDAMTESVNVRLRNSESGMSGSFERSSTITNRMPARTAPPTMRTVVRLHHS